jgi:hydrogenase nickel incorporation protein HypA/HybF
MSFGHSGTDAILRRPRDGLMHELSIAASLADLVTRHAPSGSRVLRVELRIGALQAIEPEALRMGWQAATLETPLAGSELDFELLPWELCCLDCGRRWESPELGASCTCGSVGACSGGSDEITLVALEIDDEHPGQEAGEGPREESGR